VRTGTQNKKFVSIPFWIPASNYFALTFSFAVAVFFIVLGVLHEDTEDFSFIFAGICFCTIVVTAVIVRGKLLLRYQMRLLVQQESFNSNIKKNRHNVAVPNKLTLEKNNAILKDIERKSKAADVLGKLSDAHWEVFELCNSYLDVARKELETVGAGSPRIPALRIGSDKIRKLHKHHLLIWAANESKFYTQESRVKNEVVEKIESGNKALLVLETALQFYPEENRLLDSVAAVKEFILSTKITNWIEEAEKAKFNGENQRAITIYRDALFQLARENVRTEEKDLIAAKINAEVDKLRDLIN
jgi:hypothetical protein